MEKRTTMPTGKKFLQFVAEAEEKRRLAGYSPLVLEERMQEAHEKKLARENNIKDGRPVQNEPCDWIPGPDSADGGRLDREPS